MSRKEKERESLNYHMDRFRRAQVSDPFFVLKTAFFQKGKYGRQVQLFESELKRGEDIFIEFIDIIRDESGKEQRIEPAYADRPVFRYKSNPYFAEEYDVKEGTNANGDNYLAYTIPLSELMVIMPDGSEITYNLYEKRKAEAPKEQISLSVFPNFEDEFIPKLKDKTEELSLDLPSEDEGMAEITIRDFAAIMWKQPVSKKNWLNDLIKQQ
jgi:hypothetical protein